jgi:hypothetical protein
MTFYSITEHRVVQETGQTFEDWHGYFEADSEDEAKKQAATHNDDFAISAFVEADGRTCIIYDAVGPKYRDLRAEAVSGTPARRVHLAIDNGFLPEDLRHIPWRWLSPVCTAEAAMAACSKITDVPLVVQTRPEMFYVTPRQ